MAPGGNIKGEEGPGGLSSSKDIHYDPWLITAGPTLRDFVASIFEKVEQDAPHSSRQRKDARERRKAILENLVANFALLVIEHPQGTRLAISLKNTAMTRYDRQDFPREVIRMMVDRMEAAGLVGRFMGRRGRERTALAPTAAFRSRMSALNIRAEDIGRAEGAETILLRATNGRGRPKALVDYDDTPETVSMRQEMETINAALAAADIRLAGRRMTQRHLVRIFQVDANEVPHFGNYGRMYRGFWQPLKRTERHLLTINGDPVADLDYRSMFLSLAYHLQGVAMLDSDPYAIPGLEGHREGTKKAISALFSRSGPICRLSEELRALLPKGWTAQRLMAAITAAHPAIATIFGSNIAPRFTLTESRIMVAVLLRLISQGIVALPCHDGLLVAESFKAAAVAAMREVSAEMLGLALPVEEKAIWRPQA